jgi:TorA maturation chaperone TorD/ferredoxin-like protein FixX
MTNLRADLYHALAEAFADPPQWLTLAGREWCLYEIASNTECLKDTQCLEKIANIPAESYAQRLARYTSLFVGTGRPRFWLYESASLNRLLGPETFAVAKLYRAAGLETIGAELPDHISNELAFLAHLARLGQDEILPDEKKFIEDHAGRWLPRLGRALTGSGDEVYAPIGQLLADWMEEIARQCGAHKAECGRATIVHHSSFHIPKLPTIHQADRCSLCGFCAQVCPTHALLIRETRNETALVLKEAACIRCGKCERICETRALTMQPAFDSNSSGGAITLRQSLRVECRGCGEPMVSQAEFDFVTTQIGHPTWLDYCLECRSLVMERSQ